MKYLNEEIGKKKISKVALGTARFGTKVSDEKAFQMMDLFWECGGTILDTARSYNNWLPDGTGKSERCVGRWIEKNNCRNHISICTKGGIRGAGENTYVNLSFEFLVDELKESLNTLQTDYIDIYLLHKDEKDRSIEEIMETMQYLSEKGNITRIGVANWSCERLKEANRYAGQHGYKKFEVVQTWWSLAEYTKEMWNDETTTHMTEEMYRYLIEEKILGMAYTAQCKGFFQKAVKDGLDHIDEFLKKRILTERNLQKLQYIDKYCRENHVSPAAIVNGYITNNLLEGIALISCSTEEQLKDILAWSDYEVPLEVISQLDMI